jgi:hypothetical protein
MKPIWPWFLPEQWPAHRTLPAAEEEAAVSWWDFLSIS